LLQNLIANALKYQPVGQAPEIHIQTECVDDGMCQIIVQDNGIGIPSAYRERIFEPFVRLHGKSSEYEGTGVGLAICKRIVERHGGSISVDSAPGPGSRFMIKLPVPLMAKEQRVPALAVSPTA
jgi:two-component system sensor kinase FixL